MMNKIMVIAGVLGVFLLLNGMLLDFLKIFDIVYTPFKIMILIGLNLVCLSSVMLIFEEIK